MEDLTLPQRLSGMYPVLQEASREIWQHVIQGGRRIVREPGEPLFHTGEPCHFFLLLLDGSVKVQKLSADGHELTLYHLHPGQTCELATVCLLAGKRYPVEAIAETRVEALLLDRSQFHMLLGRIEAFREFVFSSIDRGMGTLLSLVEDIAFGPLDRRLAHTLIMLAGCNDQLIITHQEVATELGTAREVVSRLLKEFERRGWVHLQRGKVTLIDRRQLASLAVTSRM